MVDDAGGLGQAAQLTQQIIGCAFRVHGALGSGFMEKVYENAMVIELRKAGLAVRQQAPMRVWYDGQEVGDYFADLLVADEIVCELKAAEGVLPEHEMQLVNYLVATGKSVGLLINFGRSVSVKRKYRTYGKSPLQRQGGDVENSPADSDAVTTRIGATR